MRTESVETSLITEVSIIRGCNRLVSILWGIRASFSAPNLSKQRAARRASAAYWTFTTLGLRNQEAMKVNHFIPHALSLSREWKFPPTLISGGGGSGGVCYVDKLAWPFLCGPNWAQNHCSPALATKVVERQVWATTAPVPFLRKEDAWSTKIQILEVLRPTLSPFSEGPFWPCSSTLQSGHSETAIASASQVTDNDLALGHFPPVPLPDVEFLSAKNHLLELTVSLTLTRKALPGK